MRSSTLILVTILAIGLVAKAAASAGETWFEGRSDHFRVFTNLEKDEAAELVRNLERFRATLGTLVGLSFEEDYAPPLTVFAYGELDQYQDRYDMRGSAGFYVNLAEGAISVLSMEDGEKKWQGKGIETLFHEYTHHLVHQYSPIRYPVWYDEGFAEFVSTMKFEDNKVTIGEAPLERLMVLRKAGDWLSVKKILEAKGNYIQRVGPRVTRNPDRNKIGILPQYAQGWLITHFLQNHTEYKKALTDYFINLNDPDIDPETAFEKNFGIGYWEFDKKVREYWYDYKLPIFSMDVSSIVGDIEIELRQLSEPEAAAIDYEGRLRTGKLDGDEEEARTGFEEVLKTGYRSREMRRLLARLAVEEEDFEAAEAQISRLLEKAPQSAPALTLSARLMHERLGEGIHTMEDLAGIRNTCIRAIRADPTYVPALLTFARLHLEAPLSVDETVLKIVESIRFLAPDYQPGQKLEAQLLARAGRFDEAMAVARKLIDWAPSRSMRRDYESLLEEIEEQQALKSERG